MPTNSRQRFENAADPPRSLCSWKSRSSNKCLCASNVGWSQKQPNKTWAYSYNQKTNQQSSSQTRKTFHVLVTCYYAIWFFSIVLQSLSHVFIHAEYCAWYLSCQLRSSSCKWAMTLSLLINDDCHPFSYFASSSSSLLGCLCWSSPYHILFICVPMDFPPALYYYINKVKRQSSPITGLEWPRGLQEVKIPRFHDNCTGWW